MSASQRPQGSRRTNSTDIRPGMSGHPPPPRRAGTSQDRQYHSRENPRRRTAAEEDDESDDSPAEDAGPRRPSPRPGRGERNNTNGSSGGNTGPSISVNLPFGITVDASNLRSSGNARSRGTANVRFEGEGFGGGRQTGREGVFSTDDIPLGTGTERDGHSSEFRQTGFRSGSGSGLRPGFTGLGPNTSGVFGSGSGSGPGIGLRGIGLGGNGPGRGGIGGIPFRSGFRFGL